MKIILYTFLFGLICLGLEWLSPEVVVTSFLALCWLFFSARKYTWKKVVTAFLVLAGFVFLSLLKKDSSQLIVRFPTFILGGFLAVAFSRVRERFTDALESAHAIIRAVPMPIVAADVTGRIVAASDEVKKLLPDEFSIVLGHSFADVFMGNLPPGLAMKEYLDWFDSNTTKVTNLYLRENTKVGLSTRIHCIGKGVDRLLLATFEKID